MRESEKRRRKKRFNGLATRRQFGHGFLAFSSLNESLFLRTNRYTGRQSPGSVYSFLAALQQHNGRTKRRSQVRRIWLLSHRSSISSSFPSSGMVMDGLRRDAAAAISAFAWTATATDGKEISNSATTWRGMMDGWTDGRTKRRNIMDNGMAGMDSRNDTPGGQRFFVFFQRLSISDSSSIYYWGTGQDSAQNGRRYCRGRSCWRRPSVSVEFWARLLFLSCVCLVIR